MSFLKRPITSFTYFSKCPCVRSSITIVCPGDGDQAQAYHPSRGSGCFPITGSVFAPKTQSSKKQGITFIPCLSQIAKNLSNVFRKYFGSSAYTAYCNTTRAQFKPNSSAAFSSRSIKSGEKLVLSHIAV